MGRAKVHKKGWRLVGERRLESQDSSQAVVRRSGDHCTLPGSQEQLIEDSKSCRGGGEVSKGNLTPH